MVTEGRYEGSGEGGEDRGEENPADLMTKILT